MLSLAEFRLKAKGLPDYLPWAALIDNGIVLGTIKKHKSQKPSLYQIRKCLLIQFN